ncbi:MAG: transposase [Phycisphaerae bacterium]|jgi:IS605 OrfB family transposase
MSDNEKRLQKVTKFQIFKPVNMTWQELGKMLRDARYRYWRLANMTVCENYMRFHRQCRTAQPSPEDDSNENQKVKTLNRILRKMLIEEKQADEKELSRYSRDGAVSGYICGAFETMKLSAIKSKSKWREVLTGKSALPLFKRELAMPINASDKTHPSLIEKTESGEFEVDLRICQQPYPRVLLSTKRISVSERAILERLVSNKANSLDGWRHRFFEIKEKDGKWFLHVMYDFPKAQTTGLHSDIAVGVDLGWSVPFNAAISNGKARIGYRKLKALGENIKALQRQTIARRRSIQNAGVQDLAAMTARAGHGRKRILRPTEKLQNKIDNSYTTLNHQLSHCVVEFAKNHGAGIIQIENLKGLADTLKGTFLGMNWRREQLQSYIKYKAEEAGIEVKEVNPCYTSRRCSECGFIHKEFSYEYRRDNRKNGKSTEFECPKCGYKENADYNAAKNLAVLDIENKIRLQCKEQGIEYRELQKG